MRISEQDWRADVPRPLSHCGDQPGRDARWRGVPMLGKLPGWRQTIDTVAVHRAQRAQRDVAAQ